MPVYEATQTVEIAGTADECFAVLTDFPRMPEWQSRVSECRVLSTRPDGLAEEVEYVIDVKLRSVRYRLRHRYDRPTWIGSQYMGGDFRCFEGDYRFAARNGATQVTFHLRIDPGLRVPGPVAKMLNEAVMGRALQDLRRRVEAISSGTH